MCSVNKRNLDNWPARRITAALHREGVTHGSLALKLGKGRSTVSIVVCGRGQSFPVASAIAAVLGTTPDVIWPRIYPPATPAPLPGDDHRTVCVDRRGGGRRCNGERRNCRRRAGHPGRCSPVAPSAPAPTPAT